MNCINRFLSKFDILFENEFTLLRLRRHKFAVLFGTTCYFGIKISNICVQLNNLTDILRFGFC